MVFKGGAPWLAEVASALGSVVTPRTKARKNCLPTAIFGSGDCPTEAWSRPEPEVRSGGVSLGQTMERSRHRVAVIRER
jgi:hypothetical protein